MGIFTQQRFVGKVLKSAGDMARRSFKTMPRKMPDVVKNQMGDARKRLMRRLTSQKSPIQPYKMRRIRPPYPGGQRPEVGQPRYSPNFGKVLKQKPLFSNFMVSRPPIESRYKLFTEQTPLSRKNVSLTQSFLATKYQQKPYTMLTRYTTANLVGARSPLMNKEL